MAVDFDYNRRVLVIDGPVHHDVPADHALPDFVKHRGSHLELRRRDCAGTLEGARIVRQGIAKLRDAPPENCLEIPYVLRESAVAGEHIGGDPAAIVDNPPR